MDTPDASLDRDALQDRLRRDFPQSFDGEGAFRIAEAAPMRARVLLPFHERYLRPGGTVSGPAMFGLADCALYIAVLATIGWKPLAATANFTMNFLSRPSPGDMMAEARLLKVGRKLAVGEVYLRTIGTEAIVAHASGAYALPSN